MSNSDTILSAGELLVEFVSQERGCGLRRITDYRGPFPSGAPGIFADQVALTGSPSVMVGAVGADPFGNIVVDRLRQDGVSVEHVARHGDKTTGAAFVTYYEDGSRDFVYHLSASAASDLHVDQRLLARIGSGDIAWFHVSGASLGDPAIGPILLALFDAVREAGGRISFDPNVRKELAANRDHAATIARILAGTDLFLPSVEDLWALYPGASEADAVSQAFGQGVGAIALKKGDAGCAYFEKGVAISLPPHPVTAVDPTGAGDCFCATFVALIARGTPPPKALARANAAGALSVTAAGPMEGNRPLAAVEAFLRETEGVGA